MWPPREAAVETPTGRPMTAGERRLRWVVPKMNPRRASLRYRCLYPMEFLASRGVDAKVMAADDTIDDRVTLIFDAWTLFPTVCDAATSDGLLSLAERARRGGARIVVDNCDNQFAAENVSEGWAGGLQRLATLAAQADVFVCCSDALREEMQKALTTSAEFVVIDDPIEEAIRYPDDRWWKSVLSPAQKRAAFRAIAHSASIAGDRLQGRVPLVWFGSHGNQFAPGGMLDLLTRRELLESANRITPVSLSIISNHPNKFAENFRGWSFPVRYLEWDRTTFLQALRQHDISLIPSIQNPFTRCKSSNRLTLSVHHGLSVMVDSIPSYLQFGTVTDISDWETKLPNLLSNRRERQLRLQSAQSHVRKSNSLGAISNSWLALLPSDKFAGNLTGRA